VAAVALDYGEFVLLGSLCDHLAKEGKKEGRKEGRKRGLDGVRMRLNGR